MSNEIKIIDVVKFANKNLELYGNYNLSKTRIKLILSRLKDFVREIIFKEKMTIKIESTCNEMDIVGDIIKVVGIYIDNELTNNNYIYNLAVAFV